MTEADFSETPVKTISLDRKHNTIRYVDRTL
jgi:hypothetical protein